MKRFALICIPLALLVVFVLPTVAQTTPTHQRLGGIDVAQYCHSKNLGAGPANNNQDWACFNTDSSINFIFNQTHYDETCRMQYGTRNGTVFSLKDGSNPHGKDNWSCYQLIVPGAVPDPDQPQDNVRLGGMNILSYCDSQGYSAQVVNNGNEWACTHKFGNEWAFVLSSTDYNLICRNSYGASAFAVQDQSNGSAAMNWSCYKSTRAEYENPDKFFNTRENTRAGVIGAVSARIGYEVNVRASPSMEAPKLGRINWGSTWPLLGREGDWYLIEYRGQVGYVSTYWVRATQR